MEKDYKEIWYTYKQGLLDEFKDICKNIVDIQWKSETWGEEPIENPIEAVRGNYEFGVVKLKGQASVNILMIIDRIDNTPTVANLSAVYERAFEIFGIKGYAYYKLPFNQFFEETRTYKDKWEEVKSILEQTVKNTNKNSLIHEEVLKYSEEQLSIMDRIESRF